MKLYADATLVSKKVDVINTPVLKVSTTIQANFGGSFIQQYKLPWQW